MATKKTLVRPPVVFTGIQARAIGRGFATIVAKLHLTVHACAILPEHVHAVVAMHRLDSDAIMEALKRAGTRRLNAEAIHPFADRPRSSGKLPSPWAEGRMEGLLGDPRGDVPGDSLRRAKPATGGIQSAAVVVR